MSAGVMLAFLFQSSTRAPVDLAFNLPFVGWVRDPVRINLFKPCFIMIQEISLGILIIIRVRLILHSALF